MLRSQRYFPWLMLLVQAVTLVSVYDWGNDIGFNRFLGRFVSLFLISPLTHFAIFYLVLQRQKLVMQPFLGWLQILLIPVQISLYWLFELRQTAVICMAANAVVFLLQVIYMMRQKSPEEKGFLNDDNLLDTPDVFRNNDEATP